VCTGPDAFVGEGLVLDAGAQFLHGGNVGRIQRLVLIDRSKHAQRLLGHEHMKDAQELPVEGQHDDPVDQAARTQESGTGPGIASLALDQGHADALDRVERLGERAGKGGAEPSAGIQGLNVGSRGLLDADILQSQACYRISRAVERVVMHHDWHAVAAVVVVELHEIGAPGQRLCESRQHVLGRGGGITAVGDHEEAIEL
jgi:hypothetical protein